MTEEEFREQLVAAVIAYDLDDEYVSVEIADFIDWVFKKAGESPPDIVFWKHHGKAKDHIAAGRLDLASPRYSTEVGFPGNPDHHGYHRSQRVDFYADDIRSFPLELIRAAWERTGDHSRPFDETCDNDCDARHEAYGRVIGELTNKE